MGASEDRAVGGGDDRSGGAGDARAGAGRQAVGPGRLSEAIRASGLATPGDGGVILLSGGPDSVALTAGLVDFVGPYRLTAIHLNYGLRPDSDRDQAVCERVCDRLGVELVSETAPGREGNLHDWARRARYAAGERIRAARGADWIAVAHTGSDLAETIIYRLAASPGARPLLAMRARNGPVIRPLLALSRSETRDAVLSAGLEFVDDPSNDDPAYARALIRNQVLPVLAGINPGATRNIGATQAELIEDDRLLEEQAARLLADCLALPGTGPASGVSRSPAMLASVLEGADPALRRRAIRMFAERSLDRPVPVPRELSDRILRLGREPEGGQVDLGGGAAAVIESGRISVCREPGPTPDATGPERGPAGAVPLAIPGSAEWGDWTVRTEELGRPAGGPVSAREPSVPGQALVDRDALGGDVRVRGWHPGDRIRPLGMRGSKTLQDLFTDRGVPRSDRRTLPVVLADDEVVWVAGVALSDRFRIRPQTAHVVKITAAPNQDPERARIQSGRGPDPDA